MKVQGYLYRNHREDVPNWLKEDEFSLERFFESRTVYYPGAGNDGSPIRLFNRSHSAHCFVWVDQRYEFDQTKENGSLDLKGYEIRHHDLTDIRIRTNYNSEVGNTSCCHMVVYDRQPGFGDRHGAERLALLIIRAEAHSAYEQIYGDRFRTNPLFAVVIQDHGFGGNFTGHTFGYEAGAYLASNSPILNAAQRNGLPRFLLVGEHGGTRVWPGYARVGNVCRTRGGMHNHRRWLYQRQNGPEDAESEYAEQVGLYIKLATRFRLPEDRLGEWLEFNGVSPPSGSNAWSHQAVRRIGHRLGFWPWPYQ